MPCDFPFYVDNPKFPIHSSSRQIPVPCGRCPDCVTRRSNGWQFRLLQHEKISDSAHFVTLTYDTTTVPITPKGYMSICKKDVQLFLKRLRKAHPNHVRIKYYLVGEYGSKTFRPHYHAIMFNVNQELLAEAWQKGIVHVGTVSGASVAYTCKYMHKGKVIPQHQNDDRTPEFSLMSKRLGANYLTPQAVHYHQADISRNYLTLEGGQKIGMPRYYRDKIFTEEQKLKQSKQIEKDTQIRLADSEADYYRRSNDTAASGYERSDFEARAARLKNFRRKAGDTRKTL